MIHDEPENTLTPTHHHPVLRRHGHEPSMSMHENDGQWHVSMIVTEVCWSSSCVLTITGSFDSQLTPQASPQHRHLIAALFFFGEGGTVARAR